MSLSLNDLKNPRVATAAGIRAAPSFVLTLLAVTLLTESNGFAHSPSEGGLDGVIQEPVMQAPLARAIVSRFVALYDRSESDAAWELFSPKTQQILPLATWHSEHAAFLEAAGTAVGHEIEKVTWLRSPPNSAPPGLYAVFEIKCRYLMLQMCAEVVVLYSENAESAFTVLRHDHYSIERAAVQKLCLTHDTADVDFGNGRKVQIKCPPKQRP
jgi:Protein of unknown function (DUF4019)